MPADPDSYPSRASVVDGLFTRYLDTFKLRQGAPKDITAFLFRELQEHLRGVGKREHRGVVMHEVIDAAKNREDEFPSERAVRAVFRALGQNLRHLSSSLDSWPVEVEGVPYFVQLIGPTSTERGDGDADLYWIDARFQAVPDKPAEPPAARIAQDARIAATETLVLALVDDIGRAELREPARDLFDDARGGPSLDRYIDEEMVKLLRDVEKSVSTDRLTPEHRLGLRNAMFQAEAEYLEIVAAAQEKIGEDKVNSLNIFGQKSIQKLLSAERQRAWVIIFALTVVWSSELGGTKQPSFESLIADLRDQLPERVSSPYFQRILDTVQSSLGVAEQPSGPPSAAESAP
jgi:hypothetical protein